MEKLSPSEYRDITRHACEQMTSYLHSAFQLIDDPEQRAAMAFEVAAAMTHAAAGFTAFAFKHNSGKRIRHEVALVGVVKEIMKREGIECREVDQL
jgi:hypothetical protein